MRARIWVASAVIASVGVAAFAHGGATGIVKERMDGMSAMGEVVKALTPMMRGETSYDAAKMRDAADVMIMHAGEQMTRLFPEGTGAKPSAALPTVWENWDDFAELAEQLKSYAEGMKVGAGNGLAKAQAQQSGSMMGGTTDTMMGGSMMGAPAAMTPEMIASMPSDMAFAAVAQVCSACHQKFRAKVD